jgi:GGDEF domain-containing protein
MSTVTSLSRIIEALKAEIEVLRREARYDKLTGLGNRRLLEERTEARGGYFVAIDLNGFKAAQDAHPEGHGFGDEVLRNFARFLLEKAQASDRVACRTGGDEFVVWCATYRGALDMCTAIHAWSCAGVTASAGIGSTMVTADRRLYEAKAALASR